MSTNDPSDDELEREAMRDVPAANGGTRGHAPRLGTESRAINPRAVLQAEADGQSAPRRPFDDVDPVYRRPASEELDVQRRDIAERARSADYAAGLGRGYREEMRQRSTLPRGMARVLPLPPRPPAPPPLERFISLEQQLEMKAWDAYASSATQVALSLNPDASHEDAARYGAEVADALLEERRRRFGA